MSVSISGDGSVTGIDQGLNVVGVVTATTISVGSGTSVSSPATNVLTLGTNNSERVRINSSGAVGLGTANPQERLHNSITANNQNYLRLDNPSGTSYYGLNSSGDTEINAATNNNIIFKTFGTERSRITSTGNVQIANGNLVFSTAGTGIDFSATTDATGSSSELLSDYEEGVHTVTLKRSSGGTTLTQGTHYNILSSQTTSNSNQYRYIKIGNIVHLSFSIRFLASESGQNGRYNISLPYSIAGNGYSFAGSIGLYNFNQTLNQGIFLSASATSLDFFDLAAGNGTHTNLYPNSGAEIYFNGYYFTI